MAKFKNHTSKNGELVSQQVILTHYVLDSSLVLLPGIVYNVTFSRFKAAALLSRFAKVTTLIPLIQTLLSEYEFDDSSSESSAISDDAKEGIRQFFKIESSDKEDPLEFDWLLLCISPNLSKITKLSSSKQLHLVSNNLNVATICRIVGIVDDTSTVKITFQALIRASHVPGYKPKKPTESLVSVHWGDKLEHVPSLLLTFRLTTELLFLAIDRFIADYRLAVSNQPKSSKSSKSTEQDLLTLNPLATALYLQLAGSKEFSKVYQSLQKIVNSLKSSPSKVEAAILLRMIDLTAAIIPFPNHEKLRMLTTLELKNRVLVIQSISAKLTEVFKAIKENSQLANHWFYHEASNIQRANLVANLLKSIRIVLEGLSSKNNKDTLGSSAKKLVRRKGGNDSSSSLKGSDDNNPDYVDEDGEDEDLRAIAQFIKNTLPHITSLSDDSKRLLVKDFKRVKSSPPGNADFHVLRNYLEIVMDLPWDKFVSKYQSNKDINIEEAQRQLDEDHHGLEHVKTRLIQYLVVLKLMGRNADKEYERLGLKNEKERKDLQAQRENRKFTRESSNGEALIIPNNDDTKTAKREASEQNQRSRDLINQRKENSTKSLLALKNNRSPIIMLAGPPGVGKTSLAKSIANVMGRKFQRVSLGGVRDESEIRGHRRTYVGAMPGTIIQALRKARSMNPVILLDEIDKVVGGTNGAAKFSGDPAAALLEVLDPEQNHQFMDHYLGFPVDLSQIVFICTANEPYNLSKPLLDRMEMIDIGAYDYDEKLKIGQRFLLPRQIMRNGFSENHMVNIDDNVMKKIILDYTREAGVRSLERRLGTICRFKAVEYAESLSDSSAQYNPGVNEQDLAKFLGVPMPKLSSELTEIPSQLDRFGIVNGLSYNTDGSGSVLIFESMGFINEKSGLSLNMTGRLGEVLMESGKIGLTFIKNLFYKNMLDVDNKQMLERMNQLEIHMHVPSGAVQKDGPSAGITMALLFLSLVLEKPVPLNIAMTGEITLRGMVLPIGGLKEKMLGAHLTGHITKVIVPRENRRDIIEEYVQKVNEPKLMNQLLKDDMTVFNDHLPEKFFEDKYGVQVVYAREFCDVVRHVWGEGVFSKPQERIECHF